MWQEEGEWTLKCGHVCSAHVQMASHQFERPSFFLRRPKLVRTGHVRAILSKPYACVISAWSEASVRGRKPLLTIESRQSSRRTLGSCQRREVGAKAHRERA